MLLWIGLADGTRIVFRFVIDATKYNGQRRRPKFQSRWCRRHSTAWGYAHSGDWRLETGDWEILPT
ncbi:hypothetical protein SLEP1_g5255 [Rubroshorea leprosula]|uniref:Transposase n=1 Tax=Rubroshorea leprosula TaxID=152421 RepID=A0AAV5HX95_9ROSI|nr:hypothetical protein SLEP1_g5255 [Rubroshorea leprosula]